MGYKSPHEILVPVMSGTGDPLDSTTYFVGFSSQPFNATVCIRAGQVYVGVTGRVIRIYLTLTNLTASTNEDMTISLRLNDTTDYLIIVAPIAQYTNLYKNEAMNVPVVPTDFLTIKVVCPAWVTNPTGVRLGGYAVVSCE